MCNRRNTRRRCRCGISRLRRGCRTYISYKSKSAGNDGTFRTYCFIDEYGRLNVVSSTQIVFHVRRILSMHYAFKIKDSCIKTKNWWRIWSKTEFYLRSISSICHMDDKRNHPRLFFQEKSLRSHLHQDMRCR